MFPMNYLIVNFRKKCDITDWLPCSDYKSKCSHIVQILHEFYSYHHHHCTTLPTAVTNLFSFQTTRASRAKHMYRYDYLTPQDTVFLGKLPVSQLVMKFSTFNVDQLFITVFKTTRHLPLFRARLFQFTPSPSLII
jgi:hypothetical protein